MSTFPTITDDKIINKIYLIREKKIILDDDLAQIYGVETKVLNQAVRRNLERFPEDLMSQLSMDEHISLMPQFVTSNNKGGRRYLPYGFTKQGVVMLSSVLKSKQDCYSCKSSDYTGIYRDERAAS